VNCAAIIASDHSISIEPASWRDLNQVRLLEKACFPKDAWPLWDIIGVLTLPNVIRLKAICNQQLVGFIAGDIRHSEKVSWIATIGVLPEFRRKGIGAALLMACEEQIPTPVIRLCVRASNAEAICLYTHYGYYTTGQWPQYYQDGEDAHVMEKMR
jgi:ribosomal-protein-alanine N-acetyltransferase